MRRRIIDAAFLATWLSLQTFVAQAQSRQDDAAYHEAINRALQEFNLGHWTEAKVFFREAHARKPSARTLRGIGLACYESRNYVEAIDYLGQALENRVQPLTAEMRAAANKLIEQSRRFVMRAQIELSPKNAALFVDGKPVSLGADGSVLIDPGEHEISATAPGYATVQRRVNSEGGSERQLHFELSPQGSARAVSAAQPAPEATVAEAPAPLEAEPADEGGSALLPWLAIGGSVAVAATGGVLLGLGLSDKAAVEDTRDGGSWSSKKSANDRAVPLQVAGGVMLGVGVAGLAASLAWELWPSDERESALLIGPGVLTLRERF
jgi:hypothetical protein